jgi:hypothetical protein
MTTDHAIGVDLRSASLCIELDCNTVFDGTAYRHCPRCGNAECFPLALWLDRAGQARDAAHREPRLPGADTHRCAATGPRVASPTEWAHVSREPLSAATAAASGSRAGTSKELRHKTNGSREPLIVFRAAGHAPGASG